VAWEYGMTSLREHADQYLAMRRALGFKLESFGTGLYSFIAFAEAASIVTVTEQAALDWAIDASRSSDQVIWSRRLMIVRSFTRHLAVLEPATQVPAPDILPHHYRRIAPHLFTPGEITALQATAGTLRPQLRGLTWSILIGLLATTGLRVGEACHLDDVHVDLDEGVLTVLDSKFGKSRRVPIHATTSAALAGYQQVRRARFSRPATAALLVNSRGTRLDEHNASHTFTALLQTANLPATPGRRRPRLADLRHSFATATLTQWYRDGGDVQARLPLLATYLGHADPKSTYWYLSASPELLALAAARLEHAFAGGTP
jgi:integrase/recombinase XerD